MKALKVGWEKSKNRLTSLAIFGIAFGFLEAAVVVYLREILYPTGFSFPLGKNFSSLLFTVEYVREFATLIILGTVAYLAGRTLLQKFAYFLYIFGVWDLFYYVGLKIFIGWPESFLTWDVLFQIPVTWIGPVLAPIILSLSMILFALIVILKDVSKIRSKEWWTIGLGAFTVFLTFIWDFSKIIFQGGYLAEFFQLADNQEFLEVVLQFVPVHYNWPLFLLGEALILYSLWMIYQRS